MLSSTARYLFHWRTLGLLDIHKEPVLFSGIPISSLASVITIVGSATESVNVLLTFFRQFRNAGAQVHQWLTMLQSLHSTLSSMRQCGRNLDPRYHFSPHFQQRLVSCVNQLQTCTSELARIDADLVKESPGGKSKWNHKARRSLGRAKWAVMGDHKMKKITRILNFYHFEFVMELLKMLMYGSGTNLYYCVFRKLKKSAEPLNAHHLQIHQL